MKEYEIIQALSGMDKDIRGPKAGIGLYHEIIGNDESVQEVESVFIRKPEIRIYKDFSNLVRIDCVYDYPDDQDLLRQYMLLENFFMPENSANFNEIDLYETNVTNHEIFSFEVLDAINGTEGVFVEFKGENGEVLSVTGQAFVDLDTTMSMFYLVTSVDDEENPENGQMIDIKDVIQIKLGDEEIYSNPLSSGSAEKKVLYTHALTINVISLNPHGKFVLTTKDNPLFYSLMPIRPNEPAKILRLTYQKDDVVIMENSDDDVKEMEESALKEIEFEEAYQ